MCLCALLAISCTCVAAASCRSPAIHVRSPETDGRVWQAKVPTNGVIRWRWEAATSATLVATSVLDRVVIGPFNFIAGAERYGEWTLPSLGDGRDALYDLVLTLRSGEATIETLGARVVVPAREWCLRVPGSREWSKIERGETRLFTYDAAWSNETTGASSAGMEIAAGGGILQVPLSGTAGWESLDIRRTVPAFAGDFTMRLLFDGQLSYVTALRYGTLGMMLICK